MALRPYLGFAFLLALVLWKIKLTKKRIFLFAILYFLHLPYPFDSAQKNA